MATTAAVTVHKEDASSPAEERFDHIYGAFESANRGLGTYHEEFYMPVRWELQNARFGCALQKVRSQMHRLKVLEDLLVDEIARREQ